jgi:hypothetical protein
MDFSLPTVMSVCDTIDTVQRHRHPLDVADLTEQVRAVYAKQGTPLDENVLRKAVALHALPEFVEPVVAVNAPPVILRLPWTNQTAISKACSSRESAFHGSALTEGFELRFEAKSESFFRPLGLVKGLATLGIVASFIFLIFNVVRQSFNEDQEFDVLPVLMHEVANQSTDHAANLIQGKDLGFNSQWGNLTVSDVSHRPAIRWSKASGKICQAVVNEALTAPSDFEHVALSIDGHPLAKAVDLQDFSCASAGARFDIRLTPI